jgi:acylphosphatase
VNISVHLIIHGRVQGVGFRDSMCQQANAEGVAGWARNRRDGTVEATIQGPEEAVQRMIAWAHHGPRLAGVTRVEMGESNEDCAGFDIRPTT